MKQFCPIVIILLLHLFSVEVLYSAVTVTAPPNGICLEVAPGSFTTLNDIVITEGLKDDLPTQTNTTLILTVPTGFEFNPGIGTVTGQIPAASGNITALSIGVTSSTITITMSVSGTNKWDEITISGIQVRALSYGISGNILRLAGVGGTASIDGNAAGAGVNHGYLEAKDGTSIYSIANGNWTNPAIWSTGVIPSCEDTVYIHNNVTVDSLVSVSTLIIETTGYLQANFRTDIDNAFYINGNGTYVHNFADNASNSIFNGTEYFSATSNILITAWYNTAIPFPTDISSDFGNITFNAGAAWGQEGMFAPSKIKGTTTVSSGTITMDEGDGMTTYLELGEVIVNNTGALIMASGSARNLTLITGSYTDTSTSATRSTMILNSAGNLNWTANGNVYISHNWSGYQHSGTNPGNTSITINGDFTIAGGQFNINTNVNAPLTLNVSGNTTITNSPTYVRFIDRNGGDLNFTTTNFYINGGNATNILGGSNPTGNGNINIANDFVVTGVGTSATIYNSSASTGTLLISVGRDVVITDGSLILANNNGSVQLDAARNIQVNSSTGTLRGQINASCNATTIINVTGFMEVNSGTIRVSEGLGNIELHIVENVNINNGTFYGIYNLVASNNGTALLNCDHINFNGGIFSFFTSTINDGKTIEVNCSSNIEINFQNNTDIFTFIAMAGSNNAILDLNIDYHLLISGNYTGSYFLSSASSGIENISIGGSMVVDAGDVYFVGNEGSLSAAHSITTSITGDLIINGGNTRLSTGNGNATINVSGDVTITGGTVSLKYNTGAGAMTINGNYLQSGGTFNIHSAVLTTPNSSTITVYGSFTLNDGIFNFDNYASSSGLAEHNLEIRGASYTISGNARITHANNFTSNWIFGYINFTRPGTTTYSRNSSTNEIEHIKYYIAALTTVDASLSNYGFQMTSVPSSNENTHMTLNIFGTFDIGDKVIVARQYSDYYSRVFVRNNARYRLSHTGGLYSGSSTVESSINGFVTTYNRVGYTLALYSTVEYYGTTITRITGIPNGYANSNLQKYGNLEINFTGAAGSTWVYPEETGEVFIRNSLILTEGEFNLDEDHNTTTGGRIIILENGATITRINGFIRSETDDGSGRVRWSITTNGSYTIPFGYNAASYIPFTFQQTSGNSGMVEIGTYRTIASNVPYPPTVTHVRDMNGIDNSAQTVDRFWNIIVPGTSNASLTFSYVPLEGTGVIAPRAQQWEPLSQAWFPPAGVQSNPTGNTTLASGLSSFNTWWTLSAAASPLPVELIYFDANIVGENVKLTWETASEYNSDYFEIQKSRNGTNYETIGSVVAAGMSNSILQYSYFDKLNFTGDIYYRLKQIDFDGTYAYSDVRMVKIKTNLSFSIHPTLVNTFSDLQISVPAEGYYKIRITDMTGKLVFIQSKIYTSNSTINLDLSKLSISRGVYQVTVAGNPGLFNQKVVVY